MQQLIIQVLFLFARPQKSFSGGLICKTSWHIWRNRCADMNQSHWTLQPSSINRVQNNPKSIDNVVSDLLTVECRGSAEHTVWILVTLILTEANKCFTNEANMASTALDLPDSSDLAALRNEPLLFCHLHFKTLESTQNNSLKTSRSRKSLPGSGSSWIWIFLGSSGHISFATSASRQQAIDLGWNPNCQTCLWPPKKSLLITFPIKFLEH